jgi:hypothetical protein
LTRTCDCNPLGRHKQRNLWHLYLRPTATTYFCGSTSRWTPSQHCCTIWIVYQQIKSRLVAVRVCKLCTRWGSCGLGCDNRCTCKDGVATIGVGLEPSCCRRGWTGTMPPFSSRCCGVAWQLALEEVSLLSFFQHHFDLYFAILVVGRRKA